METSGGQAQGLARQCVPTGSLARLSPLSQLVCAPAPLAPLGGCSGQGLPHASLPTGLVKLLCPGCKGQGRARSLLRPFPPLGSVTLAVLRLAWEDKGCLVCWDHPSSCFKLAGHWGCPWLCSPGTLCLLAAGRGDTEYGDLEEEGKTEVPSSQCSSGPGCHVLCCWQGCLRCWGTGTCPGTVLQVLPVLTAPSVLPGHYLYVDEDGESSCCPGCPPFPLTDLSGSHVVCAGTHKSSGPNLVETMRPLQPQRGNPRAMCWTPAWQMEHWPMLGRAGSVPRG